MENRIWQVFYYLRVRVKDIDKKIKALSKDSARVMTKERKERIFGLK